MLAGVRAGVLGVLGENRQPLGSSLGVDCAVLLREMRIHPERAGGAGGIGDGRNFSACRIGQHQLVAREFGQGFQGVGEFHCKILVRECREGVTRMKKRFKPPCPPD